MNRYTMGSVFFLLSGCLMTFPSFANNDNSVILSAKAAVAKKLEILYKPGECEKWGIMSENGIVSEDYVKAKCDNDFNPAFGIEFSSLYIKKYHGTNVVCGIVSGRTDLSRIGARFVYYEKTGDVTLKHSKYPIFSLASSGESGKSTIHIVNKQYELEFNLQCK